MIVWQGVRVLPPYDVAQLMTRRSSRIFLEELRIFQTPYAIAFSPPTTLLACSLDVLVRSVWRCRCVEDNVPSDRSNNC